MASRGSYDKQSIPKGGGGKQLKIGGIKAPKPTGGAFAPTPKARTQKTGAMPRSPGYFGASQVF